MAILQESLQVILVTLAGAVLSSPAPAQEVKKPSDAAAEAFRQAPPDVRLAAYQATSRGVRRPMGPVLEEIRALLKKADALYAEDETEIANMTLYAWYELVNAKAETDATLLLAGSLTWAPPDYFKQGVPRKYAEYIAACLTDRLGDTKAPRLRSTHKEAIRNLQLATYALSGKKPPPAEADPPASPNAPDDAGRKRAQTLLAAGKNLESQGKVGAAASYYRDVVSKYPGTAEAKEAASRLKSSGAK